MWPSPSHWFPPADHSDDGHHLEQGRQTLEDSPVDGNDNNSYFLGFEGDSVGWAVAWESLLYRRHTDMETLASSGDDGWVLKVAP